MADLVSDVSEDGEISEPREFVVDDDSLNIKPPQNQAGSKHKTGRVRQEHKRRDKHKHRRHESKRQHRERRERRDHQPHEQQSFLEPHDQSRPSRSHERREARRERRAQREPPPPEPRMYREPVEEPPVAVRERHRAERPHTERAPPSEGDLRRERFIQAVRVSEYQKEMSKRELEARRHRREIEKLRQRELREIELKREREYSDDREGGERRKRSRRVVENTSEVQEVDLEPERDVKDGRERESRDARDRDPRDERDRDAREGRTRELREDRIREPREDRVRESREDRVREPREERVREPREERNREPREDRTREEREDRIREPREDRAREPRDDRVRERDGREREPREERDRSKKSDQDRSSEDEDDDEEDGVEDENKESSSSSSEESADEEEEADEDDEEEDEEEEEEEDERQETRELSRSPTPPVTGRRWRQTSQSSAEAGSPGRAMSPVLSISPPSLPLATDSPPPSPVELKAVLPPYLPAVQGCRNVEEFNCLNRIEEGTYGVVYRAVDKKTKEIVALKRLKMENEKEGFPITSLREINTLLKAQHENIVTVREIVVGSNMDKIYIVMDYVEHDLKGLMQTMKSKKQSFTTGEVKCLLLQMLRAVRHLHDNWILHRDLKTSNLLLSHKGILKVGDFGLAREYGSPLKPYTPVVVTLWYRAPELLLGVKEYACPIDMWSVGCIFAELVRMDPMFPGKSEADQINRIFKELGTPNETIWPGYGELPAIKKMTFTEYPYNQLANKLGGAVTEKGVMLMNKLLTYDPKRRITADEALAHSYFDEQPRPIEPSMFPTWPAKSEMGHKKATGASPKPPSGRKNLGDEDVGFQLGAAAGAGGFSLKF